LKYPSNQGTKLLQKLFGSKIYYIPIVRGIFEFCPLQKEKGIQCMYLCLFSPFLLITSSSLSFLDPVLRFLFTVFPLGFILSYFEDV
jgi:hypothetical protein